ncbi:MAG: MMPL family transporter, partial [Desulfobacterales bacterium]|nr:MMPL family transporter [Desulfobacterales bacterium]
MDTGSRVGAFAVDHPRLIAAVIVGITLILVVLAGLPSLWPHRFAPLHSLTIDTDPENMLPEDEAVRVFHDRMKELMSLNDMIVVGIVNEADKQHGVFNPDSLEKIYALTRFARGLRWRDPDNPARRQGVVEPDMIVPSMMDNVESGGAGMVRFEWLMPQPPETGEQALEVRRKAMDLPFLNGTLVSEDGKAIALYLPITAKDVSHRIYTAIEQKIENPARLFVSEIGNFNDTLNPLAAASNGQGDRLVRMLWTELSPKTQKQLLDAHKQGEQWQRAISQYESAVENNRTAPELKERVRRILKSRNAALGSFVADINAWMQEAASEKWINPDPGVKERLNEEGQNLLSGGSGTLSTHQQKRLKRLWLEAAFGGNITETRVASLQGDEQYHVTGLPVAEDTFGVQMFKQMAISAPLAMVIIFLLLWFFFRSPLVILPAMFDAMIASAATMALLVITGNTVHIMSSMIPIFIVPIAVLDDVHVLSEFFDRYQETRDRKKTVKHLMSGLFKPMLYTTLTTAVGFASLALAPIPPVQVFGLFVAFGVIVAWLCSILLVPAFITALPDRVLDRFGARHVPGDSETVQLTLLGRLLRATGRWTFRWAKPIIAISVVALVVAGYGISLIRVNDNPTKWFEPAHPIRIADRVLNEHFGGTYMAYLAFRPEDAPRIPPRELAEKQPDRQESRQEAGVTGPALPAGMDGASAENTESGPALPGGLGGKPEAATESESAAPAESPEKQQKAQIFKDPATLRWIGALENYMHSELGGLVGKSNSVTDIVETVHRELMVGVERDGRVITRNEAMRVPDSPNAVVFS